MYCYNGRPHLPDVEALCVCSCTPPTGTPVQVWELRGTQGSLHDLRYGTPMVETSALLIRMSSTYGPSCPADVVSTQKWIELDCYVPGVGVRRISLARAEPPPPPPPPPPDTTLLVRGGASNGWAVTRTSVARTQNTLANTSGFFLSASYSAVFRPTSIAGVMQAGLGTTLASSRMLDFTVAGSNVTPRLYINNVSSGTYSTVSLGETFVATLAGGTASLYVGNTLLGTSALSGSNTLLVNMDNTSALFNRAYTLCNSAQPWWRESVSGQLVDPSGWTITPTSVTRTAPSSGVLVCPMGGPSVEFTFIPSATSNEMRMALVSNLSDPAGSIVMFIRSDINKGVTPCDSNGNITSPFTGGIGLAAQVNTYDGGTFPLQAPKVTFLGGMGNNYVYFPYPSAYVTEMGMNADAGTTPGVTKVMFTISGVMTGGVRKIWTGAFGNNPLGGTTPLYPAIFVTSNASTITNIRLRTPPKSVYTF